MSMQKLRFRGKKRRTGYTPVHTMPIKKKKKKHDFVSKSRSTEINKQGIELEKLSMTQKNFLFGGIIVASFILLILDIRDDGMFFEGFGFKYSGSLGGVIFLVIAIVGIMQNKPKVSLE